VQSRFRKVIRRVRRPTRILWYFIPETSIARDGRMQRIMASRFLSDGATQALLYGALINVVRGDGSPIAAALVGCAGLLPGAIFGLPGGVIADLLPRRLAVGLTYAIQGALCIALPTVMGDDLASVLLLVFIIVSLGQISGPAEPALMPLVADDDQMASANSFLNLASVAGSGFGTALLAPVIVRAFDVTPLFYMVGVLFLLASLRVFDRRPPPTGYQRQRAASIGPGSAFRWLVAAPGAVSMLLLAALAATANTVVQTLSPNFVQEQFGIDPSASVYVLAPATLGLLLALAASPPAIGLLHERWWAITAFAITAAALFALGFVDVLTGGVDRWNPLRLLGIVGIELDPGLRTAALFAIPLGFGLNSATAAVNTFINRQVPPEMQGRAFAAQSVLRNAIAIPPLLAFGLASEVVGVQPVLLVSPALLLLLGYAVYRRFQRRTRTWLTGIQV
jgi:MFS family permease